ncbi:MAG: transketolase [Streptosporangiales bacterium]|nr:transketolase [Streptosporangiales bacterium]
MHTNEPSLRRGDPDRQAVDVIRVLAMDAVEEAGSGHPGTAMSLAPAAYVLFQRVLRHDPSDPHWPGRDRFVLSCGHSSLTLYIQLFLSGYGLTVDDLRGYRQWGSLTPGHPEYGHTAGVETTTGPLGQGLGNAVGMAMAARRERGLFDPDGPPGTSPFDHTIWVFASDGDMEEGVGHEAASLAGHQRLGNLVVLYDDNRISIDGNTNVAFSEDVLRRYEAYGWHTQRVEDSEDLETINKALVAARDETDRPSIIAMSSVIAYPAPHAQNTGPAHGAPLGSAEVAATKRILGFDPDKTFDVPDDVLARAREVVGRGRALHEEWDRSFTAWRRANPERAAEYDRISARRLPEGWEAAWETVASRFQVGASVATRKASGEVLTAIGQVLPELWGGSADLTGSNNTTIKGERPFLPFESSADGAHPYGRYVHFGVREHAMGAVLNGVALHGGTRPYGGTFLVFSDYMRPSVRLAAMMGLPVIYVWTHDSIGLGEDGPTHQPVEHLSALRAIPGLDVVRPADANETAAAWRAILGHSDRPAGLCLTRQGVPVLEGTSDRADEVARGGYVLAEAAGGRAGGRRPDVIVVATGSEVAIALEARELLERSGTPTRVVSMPCVEWFRAQPPDYQEDVLPQGVRARVSVEAGIAQGWREFVGDHGESVSIQHFGASAPYQVLYEKFGLTPERIVAAARTSLARVGGPTGYTTGS